MGGRAARQDDPESPGSDGASPYMGLPALKIDNENENEDEHD